MNDWVKYRLRDESGTDLGVLMSPNSAWTVGDVVHRGPTAAYAIVGIVETDETDDAVHCLVVTQAPE